MNKVLLRLYYWQIPQERNAIPYLPLHKIVCLHFVQDPIEFFYYDVYGGAFKGYMTGYEGTNLFGPWDKVDRQTVAVALYKLEGSPSITKDEIDKELSGFTDPDEIANWAKTGLARCSKTGKFTGFDNKDGTWTAKPIMSANREMIATYLWRFAGKPVVKSTEKFDKMPDKNSVSKWALDGTKWCMGVEIISDVEIEGKTQNLYSQLDMLLEDQWLLC